MHFHIISVVIVNTDMTDKKFVKRMASSGMLRCVVLTRATRHNIPEDAILLSHCHENLKS
jgi:hypothetical protein